MRKITFVHNRGWGEHNRYTEVQEFDDDATEKDIQDAYVDWVWEQIGDNFTWFEGEEAQ